MGFEGLWIYERHSQHERGERVKTGRKDLGVQSGKPEKGDLDAGVTALGPGVTLTSPIETFLSLLHFLSPVPQILGRGREVLGGGCWGSRLTFYCTLHKYMG